MKIGDRVIIKPDTLNGETCENVGVITKFSTDQHMVCVAVANPTEDWQGGKTSWVNRDFIDVIVPEETQASVHQWVTDTFPRYSGAPNRALAVLEEAVELALAAGLTPDEIRKTMEVPIVKEVHRAGHDVVHNSRPLSENVGEESADTLLNLYSVAGVVGFDLHAELDKKMALNRSRGAEYYAMKTKQKEELGFALRKV